MKIKQVTVKKNASGANRYEHTHAEVTVELGAHDTVEKAFALATRSVDQYLGLDYTESDVKRAKELVEKHQRRLGKSDLVIGMIQQ